MTKKKEKGERKLIQGWFRKNIENERRVLEIVEQYEDNDWSQKDIIGTAILRMAERDLGVESLMPDNEITIQKRTAEMLRELQGVVLTLGDAVRRGVFTSGLDMDNVVSTVSKLVEEQDAVERSIAASYRKISFSDEED